MTVASYVVTSGDSSFVNAGGLKLSVAPGLRPQLLGFVPIRVLKKRKALLSDAQAFSDSAGPPLSSPLVLES